MKIEMKIYEKIISASFGKFRLLLVFSLLGLMIVNLSLDLRAKVIAFNPKLSLQRDFYSKDMALELSAENLVENLDSAYKFRLKDTASNQLFPLELISLNEKEINLKFPEGIDYGDYVLEYKFKS